MPPLHTTHAMFLATIFIMGCRPVSTNGRIASAKAKEAPGTVRVESEYSLQFLNFEECIEIL